MKLPKNIWKAILGLIAVVSFAVGCDTYVKANGDGNAWSFEAGASAKAEMIRK